MFIGTQRSVQFGPASGDGPREIVDILFFPRPIRAAVSAFAGWSSSFVGSDDGRPFGRLVVDVGPVQFTGREAQVTCRFGLRDWSGEWDDNYAGVIDYVVYAELEDDESIGEDVIINGVEYSQAIQYFRSHLDLDAATRMSDNAVALVARKGTSIRVYVDYNPKASSGGLVEYEGELEVRTAARTEVLTHIYPVVPSPNPQRDTPESPLPKDAAPCFLIPAELCTGTVTIRGRLRVHDLDSGATSSWSATFERQLRFHPATELAVFVAGLRVVGDTAARAPTREEAEALFVAARSMFPISGLRITGFVEEEVELTTSDAILTRLVSIRGDSDDLVVGLFSEDFQGSLLSGTTGKRISGEAWESVAWAEADPNTVAHELGHVMGLDHVDTNHGEDGPYDAIPRYGAYPIGSIGQHGVDPDSGAPFEPAIYRDVMSYARQTWISLATYTGMLNLQDERSGQRMRREPPAKDVLFLALTVHRNRRVERHPSFHFPATRRFRAPTRSPFSLELTDACRRRLVCWALTTGLGPEYCWPKTFWAQPPYPPGAAWLLIWQGDHLLHEECIGAPPQLQLSCTVVRDAIVLTWSVDPTFDTWSLVQWQDRDGSWRGMGAPTRETRAVVPRGFFRNRAAVRVLATTGIATAAAHCTLELPPQVPATTIAVSRLASSGRNPREPRVSGWRAFAYDSAGRSVARPEFRWFDGTGRQIHAGATLPRRAVGPTVREVSVVLVDGSTAAGPARRSWRVRRERNDLWLDDPPSTSGYSS